VQPVFGHPLHPALVHFPLGLLLSATLADAAWALGIISDPRIATLLIAGGLAAALVAMAAGMIDFARLDQALVRHAARHMGTVGLAWLGYAVDLYLRRDTLNDGQMLSTPALALSALSALILAFGGWLGGRLVYEFGAGVAKR